MAIGKAIVPNSIGMNKLMLPKVQKDLTYNGYNQSPTWLNYNTSHLTIGGTTQASLVGSYNTTFTPKSGYTWWDGTTAAKTVSWNINNDNPSYNMIDKGEDEFDLIEFEAIELDVPTMTIVPNNPAISQNDLVYESENIYLGPVFTGFDSTKMYIIDDKGATPGHYETRIGLIDPTRYVFRDGEFKYRNEKDYDWVILKRPGIINVSKNVYYFKKLDVYTENINIENSNDPIITIVDENGDSDDSVCRVIIHNRLMNIIPLKTGHVFVTIETWETENLDMGTITFEVYVNYPLDILHDIDGISNLEDFIDIIQFNSVKNYVRVGDYFEYTLTGHINISSNTALTNSNTKLVFADGTQPETYIAYLVHIDEYDQAIFCGGMKKDELNNLIQIAFVASDYVEATGTNYGFSHNLSGVNNNTKGWENSTLNTMLLNSTERKSFLAALDSSLSDNIIEYDLFTDNSGSGGSSSDADVTYSAQKLWLMAPYEVRGTPFTNVYEAEYQEYFDYYKNGNSKIRYAHNDLSRPVSWWLRSPAPQTNSNYWAVKSDDRISSCHSKYNIGIAFCFVF